MNRKQSVAFAMFAMVFGVAISPIVSADYADARPDDNIYANQGQLTAPSGDKPFGGDNVGTYSIHVKESFITIYAGLDQRASNGMVFEGWLVDVDTGKKQSTGTFKEDVKRGFFYAQPSFQYDIFVVTEEPIVDSEPAPNKAVAGVPLSEPFGQ